MMRGSNHSNSKAVGKLRRSEVNNRALKPVLTKMSSPSPKRFKRCDSSGDAVAESGADGFFFEPTPCLGLNFTDQSILRNPSILLPTKPFAPLGRSDSFVEDMGVSSSPSCSHAHEVPAARGRFAEDFDTIALLGSGEFGHVLKCRNKMDACDYAVKVSKERFKSRGQLQVLLREVHVLAHLSAGSEISQHIVRYHQAWVEDERLFIAMELCEQNLEDQLVAGLQMPFVEVLSFLRQMVLALEALHGNKMVHLDVKPGNIYTKQNIYKLGDFGLACQNGEEVMEEGDSRYLPIELLNPSTNRDLTKCDVFSLGCTVYEIILGEKLPKNGKEWIAIREGKLRLGEIELLPTELEDLVQMMLQVDPNDRPSAGQLLNCPELRSQVERNGTILQAENFHLRAALQEHVRQKPVLSRSSTWA